MVANYAWQLAYSTSDAKSQYIIPSETLTAGENPWEHQLIQQCGRECYPDLDPPLGIRPLGSCRTMEWLNILPGGSSSQGNGTVGDVDHC